MGAKWVHVLSEIDPIAKTATCRACGHVTVQTKGKRWTCITAIAEIAVKRKSRAKLKRSRPRPAVTPNLTLVPAVGPAPPVVTRRPGRLFPIPVRPGATPITVGAHVRLSDDYRLFRDPDTKKYEHLVGTVTGVSTLYPGMWLVRFDEDTDPAKRHPYCESWLTVVEDQPAEEPPVQPLPEHKEVPQPVLHLRPGELWVRD